MNRDNNTLQIGDEFPELVKEMITKEQIVKYAKASGDFNKIHVDDEFAKLSGMGGVIAHGMLVMGFVGEAVTNWFPKYALRRFGVRFVAMTRPGDIIKIKGKVKDIQVDQDVTWVNCDVAAEDQSGEIKVVGSFVVKL